MAVQEIDRDQKERPLPELLREVSQEITTLVGKQVELAKVELSEKAKEAGQGAGMFGGAGLFGLLALGTLSAAVILGLATFLPDWAAALIVSVVYGLIAAVLFARGKAKVSKASPMVPQQTVEAAKDTAQELQSSWSRGKASSA